MDINQLIEIVKRKINQEVVCENIKVEDKTFLHKKHKSQEKNKFHLKLIIKSKQLNTENKINSTKKIYKILDDELSKYIHSIQILIN
jgi:BolA protein